MSLTSNVLHILSIYLRILPTPSRAFLAGTVREKNEAKSMIVNKIKLRSFKSSEHLNEKKDGPYRAFGYLSLFSDPLDAKVKYCNFAIFNRIVNQKTSIIQTEPNISTVG